MPGYVIRFSFSYFLVGKSEVSGFLGYMVILVSPLRGSMLVRVFKIFLRRVYLTKY